MNSRKERPPWWFGPAIFGGMGAAALIFAAIMATG